MPRVLIVDDSPTARDILARIINQDPELEVVGFAENGAEAIEAVKKWKPDVITMDLNMPVMDGFEATRVIMDQSPTPIVIVSATSRAQEVETAMEALQLGALSLLLKPIGPASNDFHSRAKEVVQTVKAMAGVYVIRRRLRLRQDSGPTPFAANVPISGNVREQRTHDQSSPRVLAIAASTGGPPALAKILSTLPAEFPVPVLIVQHIAVGFLDGFVQWLDSVVAVRVKVAEDHELLNPGTVYVAPQDHHLGVTRQRVRLSQSDAIAGFRPAGTYLFSTVAESFANAAIGVILSGMGEDGVEGLKKIHAGGGTTIAQNEETCAVFGMPHAAIEAECVDLVLPLEKIGQRVCDLVTVRRS